MSLREIIRQTEGQGGRTNLYNNAAQAFNHLFYWKSLRPDGGGEPTGRVGEMLRKSFGGYAQFREAFLNRATSQFGSGWVWLTMQEDELAVVATSNAHTPLTRGVIPLLTVDVWEHAYYLDYQNRRADYVKACVDHLLNWSFAEENLASARDGKQQA
jgi:Fe-Mn family superoxide dismutase